MTISKSQLSRVKQICACGCEQVFEPFPLYINDAIRKNPENYTEIKGKRSNLFISRFKRGHSPLANRFSGESWNRGLKKGDHPSMDKIGFQVGHPAYNDWSQVNDLIKNDPSFRKKWLESKRGKTPWNKGLTSSDTQSIKSKETHWNWRGGISNIPTARDSREYKQLRLEVLKRDNYTCQECGDRNRKGRGSRIKLEVHHIVSVLENKTLANDKNNLVTLCVKCHRLTENYGSKAYKLRK